MASTIDPTTGLPITNQAIPTSALSTPQTPLQVPTPVDLTPTYAATIANASAQAGNDVTTAQTNVDLANQEYKAQGDAYSTLLSKSLGKEADTKQAYNQTGATELLNQVNDFKIQTDNLAREATATPLRTGQAYQGSSGTQGGIDSVNRDLLQRNALQALTVAQASAITQGKYDRAKQLADEYITNKYAGDEARLKAIEVNMSVLDKTKLTPAQEKLKAATLAKNEKDKQVLADKQAAEKAVSDMLIEASPVAPPDVMARAKAVQAKGGSAMEVATALGKYGGDYLAREKIKAEIAKMDADAIKTRADAAKTRAETTGGGTGTTGTASDNANAWLAQYNSGTMSLEDIYTKIGSSKEASVLKNEVARLIAAQGGKRVFGLDDASIQAINAQIKNVDDLLYGNGKKEIDKTTGDVGSIVGFVQGGLGVIPDSWNTGKQDALAVAKNLVSNQTLQALADAKAKGITFGALSEGELGLVADAASRISAKLKIDPKTKEIIGFTGSESQFKDDLKTIRDNLAKSIETKTQSKQSNMSKEESTADDIMTANKKIQSEINSGYNVFDN